MPDVNLPDLRYLSYLRWKVAPQPSIVEAEVALLRDPQLDGVVLSPNEGQARTAQPGEHQADQDDGERVGGRVGAQALEQGLEPGTTSIRVRWHKSKPKYSDTLWKDFLIITWFSWKQSIHTYNVESTGAAAAASTPTPPSRFHPIPHCTSPGSWTSWQRWWCW